MTIQEASERYQIPMEVLRTYERWGLCPEARQAAGERRYDGRDLERLSLLLTLRDIGFTGEGTERYMRLLERPGTEGDRLRVLEEKRAAALADIHARERQVERMDYLRHQLRKRQETRRK